MHKVIKDISQPPASLNSEKTNELREEIIRQKKYPAKKEKFSERYKQEDIKEALGKIYNSKCAYCEQNINDAYFHIEHYRPKSIYYWLAYSWDNLFLCCEKCNTIKGNKFKIEADKRIELNESDLSDIHNLTEKYNDIERPLVINPELEDVEDKLIFDTKTGSIKSDDHRCQYTIDCCKLDRKEANSNRKKIWDDFDKRVNEIFYKISLIKEQYKTQKIVTDHLKTEYDRQLDRLKYLIHYFKEDADNPGNEYLTFRRYVVKNLPLFADRD